MSMLMYQEQAARIVDNVIDGALQKIVEDGLAAREQKLENAGVRFNMADVEVLKAPEIIAPIVMEEDYEIQNIEWLTIEEFSEKRAEEKIHEFIKTWDYQDSWQYCIDYLGEDEHEFDMRYRFRVRWSIPTRRKPIPRATACIYFTFEVSKIKPKDHPVEVYYVFETHRLVHRPGASRFREKWLKDIIESKVIMMEGIDF